MKPEVKKNLFGKFEIKFDCPKCNIRLTSPLLDAGEADDCPECGAKFVVPGKQQREIYEAKVAKETAEKEAKNKLRTEERQLAVQKKSLEHEERRQKQEEDRRRNEMILAKEEEDRRRKQLANLVPPTLQGRIVNPGEVSYGELADPAECPFCAELVSLRARKCKHCGELLDPVLRAAEESRRAAARPQIVNIVHGGNAVASAEAYSNASSNASVSTSTELTGCSGCLALIGLIVVIAVIAGMLGG